MEELASKKRKRENDGSESTVADKKVNIKGRYKTKENKKRRRTHLEFEESKRMKLEDIRPEIQGDKRRYKKRGWSQITRIKFEERK